MARDPTALPQNHAIYVPETGQLRDVLIYPREWGIHRAPLPTHSLRSLDSGHTLLAAGGQDAEIHLSLLRDGSSSHTDWQFSTHLDGSINNSILLTSLSLTDSPESSVEPRMAVSNNDRVVMFFDVPIRAQPARIAQVGSVRMNVPINHSSISPDGRTLLSVGDSSKVFLHRLKGGGYVTASPIATLTLPPTPLNGAASPALVASFSTAFSADGSKYAVASQEGSVAVWDVRSSNPLKVFLTDKTRGNTTNTAWDPQEWNHWKTPGPGWSTRTVKFGGRPERELMMFTEHTSLVHVVDAWTFEREEVVQMPTYQPLRSPETSSAASILRTLEETFRVHEADGEDEVLVIPPLGDHNVEQEVRRVLQEHGLRSRMRPRFHEQQQQAAHSHPFSHAHSPSPEPPYTSLPDNSLATEPDLAGACFDPSGAYVYAASKVGVAEWKVRGAEKRWWSGGSWER
uniref:DUF2415 domain-containing protein n=1 Tax=Mycena chlorophos TaxID=658473 RepID=A0ABQ0L8J7_MYCCL|nr:predicted protein [Mycena chlorophos]